MLAASTNSLTPSLVEIPSLPASPANSFRRVRAVRVSICLNSSFSSFTSCLVSPVYLMTCDWASSISAYSLTQLRMVSVMPVRPAIALAAMAPYLLKPSVNFDRLNRVSLAVPRSSLIRLFTSLSCSEYCLYASVFGLSCRRIAFRSFWRLPRSRRERLVSPISS